MVKKEKEFIDLIKSDIEKKLFSEHRILKTRDLKYMAESIQEKSAITLSLSTLKRLWKEDFAQTPQPSTLNALASLLDYKSWQHFKDCKTTLLKDEKPAKRFGTKHYILPVLILAVMVGIWNFISPNTFFGQKKLPIIKGPISFSADKTVSNGVPNTVIFNYDVANVEADSFFIQQSWNEDHKEQIDPLNNTLSSIYYTPSFHQAKLIADDSILSVHNVHIQSQGWMPYVKYDMSDKIPFYFFDKRENPTGMLGVTKKDLVQAGVDLKREFMLRYANIRDFGQLDENNFSIRTKLRCERITNVVCPFMELLLVFEKDIFWVQLTKKGCEGDISLKIGERHFDGKENDLSKFGSEIYDWQTLDLSIENKFAKLTLNDNPIFDIGYEKNFGSLVGLIYTFKGTGSIEFVRLTDINDAIVYEDQFD